VSGSNEGLWFLLVQICQNSWSQE